MFWRSTDQQPRAGHVSSFSNDISNTDLLQRPSMSDSFSAAWSRFETLVAASESHNKLDYLLSFKSSVASASEVKQHPQPITHHGAPAPHVTNTSEQGGDRSFIGQSIGVWGHSFHPLLQGGISGDSEVLWHFIFMIVYSYTEEHSLKSERGHQTGIEGVEWEQMEGSLSGAKRRQTNLRIKQMKMWNCWGRDCEIKRLGFHFVRHKSGF